MKKKVLFLLCFFFMSSITVNAAATTPNELTLCLPAEYNRLYQIPISGGDASLLADAYTECFVRAGDILIASFLDGTVCQIDPVSGNSEVLYSQPGLTLNKLYSLKDGFVGVRFSIQDGVQYFYYNSVSKNMKRIFEDRYFSSVCSSGNVLLCIEYHEGTPELVAFDFPSESKLLDIPVSKQAQLLSFGSEIYIFYPNTGKLDRLDLATGRINYSEIPLKKTDYNLLYIHGKNCIVHGNYNDDHLYLIIDGIRRKITIPDDRYPVLYDAVGQYVLFYSAKYFESTAMEGTWYPVSSYYILNMDDGTLTDISVHGQYSKLFQAGDFPVMDSSTARKPLTASIYSFFCESSGAGGAVPLCSTTHYAWLNIADSIVDIALLAAPTQEEQDYLKEKDVNVEMKLYGGDGLVFIGNHACGVDDLTLDQIRAIYRGDITNWSEIGGVNQPIRVLYRDDQSGSQRLFERMLWKDEPVPDFEALGFDRLDDMSSIVSQCLYEPYSIGYSIMTYLNDVYGNENLLAFSLEGFSATPENVAAKQYPLSTQGYVVIRSDEEENSPARRLFNWFGSPLSDLILNNNGITPLK